MTQLLRHIAQDIFERESHIGSSVSSRNCVCTESELVRRLSHACCADRERHRMQCYTWIRRASSNTLCTDASSIVTFSDGHTNASSLYHNTVSDVNLQGRWSVMLARTR